MPRAIVLLVAVSLAHAAPTAGQDRPAPAPTAVVEHEDARVRVVRLSVPAGATVSMQDWPARVVVLLTPNDVRLDYADGTTRTTRAESGRVAWSEPAQRAVTNLADGPIENIVVELKATDGPARAAEHPPAPRPAGYLDEVRHHWLFENQYVRVYGVRLPPGEVTAWHRHAFDTVYVFVSGGRVATQVEGRAWGTTEDVRAGSVTVTADSGAPFTHRVRNDGTDEYHVVAVQLLPR